MAFVFEEEATEIPSPRYVFEKPPSALATAKEAVTGAASKIPGELSRAGNRLSTAGQRLSDALKTGAEKVGGFLSDPVAGIKSLDDAITAKFPETSATISRVGQSLLPNPTGAIRGAVEGFPTEQRKQQEIYQGVFGPAGRPLGTAAATAYGLMGAPFSVVPPVVAEPFGKALEVAREGAQSGLEAVGVPKPIARLGGQLAPDVAMMGAGGLVHGKLRTPKADPYRFIEQAGESMRTLGTLTPRESAAFTTLAKRASTEHLTRGLSKMRDTDIRYSFYRDELARRNGEIPAARPAEPVVETGQRALPAPEQAKVEAVKPKTPEAPAVKPITEMSLDELIAQSGEVPEVAPTPTPLNKQPPGGWTEADKVAAKPTKATKQPWEMTKDEYADTLIAKGQEIQKRAEKYKLPANKAGFNLYKPQGRKLNEQGAYEISQGLAIKKPHAEDVAGAKFGNPHRIEVEAAIKAGRPVPPEVLADYPDLGGANAKTQQTPIQEAVSEVVSPVVEAAKAETPPVLTASEVVAKIESQQNPRAAPKSEPATPSEVYDASLARFRQASQEFDKITKAYRSREIGDAEFLAGRKKFDEESAIADKAETEFIEKTNAESAKPAISQPRLDTPAQATTRRGAIGDMLAAGEVVATATGRETTPFPNVDTSTIGKATNTVKRVDAWLLENAILEAKARGDDFNLRPFEADAKSRSKLPPASKDFAEQYLFGDEQPRVIESPLKPLGKAKDESAAEATIPRDPLRDSMGQKHFWAKTRKEIAREGMDVVQSVRKQRAETNKLKGTKDYANWRIRSASTSLKDEIASTQQYHKGLLDVHKERVVEALAEGKPVPPEVIKDYPDLAREAAKAKAQERIAAAKLKKETPAIPAEATPAVAEAKIEAGIEKTKGAKEQQRVKKELASRIEALLQKAPTEAENAAKAKEINATRPARPQTLWENGAPKKPTPEDMAEFATDTEAWDKKHGPELERLEKGLITIAIPGDGTFKIRRTQEGLTEILKRVNRLETNVPKDIRNQPMKAIPIPKRRGELPADIWYESSDPSHWVTNSTGVRLKGMPIEVPGFEGTPMYVTSGGETYRIVEPRTGLALGEPANSIAKAVESAQTGWKAIQEKAKDEGGPPPTIDGLIAKNLEGTKAKVEEITPESLAEFEKAGELPEQYKPKVETEETKPVETQPGESVDAATNNGVTVAERSMGTNREHVIRRMLEKAQAKGEPAWSDSEWVYTRQGKFRIEDDGVPKFEHELSDDGIFRQYDIHQNGWQSTNAIATEMAQGRAVASAAKESAIKLRQDVQDKRISKWREDKAQRESDYLAELDAKVKATKFTRGPVEIARNKDGGGQEKQTREGALLTEHFAVRKPDNDKGWIIDHRGTGLKVTDAETIQQAKRIVAAMEALPDFEGKSPWAFTESGKMSGATASAAGEIARNLKGRGTEAPEAYKPISKPPFPVGEKVVYNERQYSSLRGESIKNVHDAVVEKVYPDGFVDVRVDRKGKPERFKYVSPEHLETKIPEPVKAKPVEQPKTPEPPVEAVAEQAFTQADNDVLTKAAQPAGATVKVERPAPDLSQATNFELIKKGFGTDTGTVGKLTQEQASLEAQARAARKEIYRRLSNEVTKTGDAIEAVAERMKLPRGLLDRLLKEHEPIIPVVPTPVPEPTPEQWATSIKNATVDQELAEIGLPQATHGERLSFEMAREAAAQIIQADPFASKKLMDDLIARPRPASAVEDAMLLHEQTRLKNERIAAEEQLIEARKTNDAELIAEARTRVDAATTDFMTLGDVVTRTGTESSLSLGHRRMMMKEDYSLAALERAKQVANDGAPLTDQQRAEVKAVYDKLSASEKAFSEYVAKSESQRAEMESELAASRLVREAKDNPTIEVEPHIRSMAERIVSALEAEAVKARERLKAKAGRLSAGIDPTLISDAAIIGTAKIARGILDFPKWSKSMLDELGDWISPHLMTIWDASNRRLDERIVGVAGKNAEPVKRAVIKPEVADAVEVVKGKVAEKVANGDEVNIFPHAQALAKLFVERGITDRNKLIDAVHAELKEIMPDMTRRQAMDAISGYGDYKQLSKDQVSSQLRDLKGQMQQVAKLEDIQSRQPPLKTGIEHRAVSAEERHLIQQVNEAKRRYGIVITDPATQLQSALGARKTYYSNHIADLETQIKTREKFVKEKTISPSDPELEALRVRSAELKKEFDSIFGKPELTDEQRLAAAMRGTERSIIDLERRIETGDVGPRSKAPAGPSSPALEGLRARRDALAAEVAKMRPDHARKQTEEQALRGLSKAIADLETRLSNGDISPRAKPTPLDTPALAVARARLDLLREQLQELRDIAHPGKTPEEIALQTLKTRMKRQTANLTERLATGDFSARPKREIKLDAEARKLQYENAKVKTAWMEGLINDRLRHRSRPRKVLGFVGEVMNTSRAVLTGLDLSAVLRQGGFTTMAHPIRSAKAIPDMFRAFKSKEGQFKAAQEILERENFPLYKRSKLYLSEEGQTLSQMEEAYMSRWAEHIPLVAGSQRAYTTFLNRLRADSFDAMAKGVARGEKLTPEEGNAIANFINVSTGRGSVGLQENAMVGLNTVFFSPRYAASRFQLLAGQPLYRGTAKTRTAIATEYARTLAGLGVVYGLAQMAGAEIEIDPRSSDFGKIKIGNTRIDPMMGLSQVTVLVSRLATGETKSIRGKVSSLRGGKERFGGRDSADVIGGFLRSKLSPAFGTGINIVAGKNVVGEPTTPESVAENLVTPLAVRDIYEAMKEQGVPSGAAMGILGTFGMSLQTFDANKKRVQDNSTFAERWGLAGNE